MSENRKNYPNEEVKELQGVLPDELCRYWC